MMETLEKNLSFLHEFMLNAKPPGVFYSILFYTLVIARSEKIYLSSLGEP